MGKISEGLGGKLKKDGSIKMMQSYNGCMDLPITQMACAEASSDLSSRQ